MTTLGKIGITVLISVGIVSAWMIGQGIASAIKERRARKKLRKKKPLQWHE